MSLKLSFMFHFIFPPQVPFRHKAIYSQWDKRNMGARQIWAANETERARDVGEPAQPTGQQSLHLGEAHRSLKVIHSLRVESALPLSY